MSDPLNQFPPLLTPDEPEDLEAKYERELERGDEEHDDRRENPRDH